MTTTIRAKFDGKVLIPEGPVDLPVDQVLEFQVTMNSSSGPTAFEKLLEFAESLPPDEGPVSDLAAQHDHYLYGAPKRP